jgi:site-specific DNA-methyltransferase (adenine-specific)
MTKNVVKIGDATLYCGDANDILSDLEQVDSCVTDPPYGLSFMGKAWDYDVPSVDIWTQVYDVLKPGAHLLSFFGSRTYHRGAIPIEDAGFEIRDQLMWLYGSGFPKSHNIGKAVDKLQGNEREVVGKRKAHDIRGNALMEATVPEYKKEKSQIDIEITKGNSEWEGWGTALKPAHEPIVMARKLIKGTVAENVLEHGTGGINIDDCRVGTESLEYRTTSYRDAKTGEFSGQGQTNHITGQKTVEGRFPANVMHDGSEVVGDIFLGDSSGYFYCPKASKKDRDEGLENFEEAQTTDGNIRSNSETARTFGANSVLRKNVHPTVKPTELMRYLCRLVTPKGGVVLDPFMGSGSTGKASIMSGFKFVGIELNEEYFDIACARVEAAQKEWNQIDLFS